MARKHFDLYFNELLDQYEKMKHNLNEFEILAQDNIVTPEQVETIKETVKPIADSFNFAAYIKYLLDMPAKKEKQSKYKRSTQKILKKIPKESQREFIEKQNEDLIASMCEVSNDG